MPTGYTSIIDYTKGEVPFEKFLWRCVRAFFYDCGPEDKIPEPKLDTDYRDKLEEAEAELAKIQKMSVAECATKAEAAHKRAAASTAKYEAEAAEIAAKYAAMRERVNRWRPPTDKHKKLKEFMLEQLETGKPYEPSERDEPCMTGAEWKAEFLASAKRDIEYYGGKWVEAQKRYTENVAWLKALRDAVKEV